MDPFTIALFAIGANIAGGFLKARAASASADANAQTLDQNARMAEMAAGGAIDRGEILAGRALMLGGDVAAKQKTAYAASGVVTQSGSPVDVQESTRGLSALDALTARNNAALTAWGYRTQAANFRHQAGVTRTAGQMQAAGAVLGAIVGSARYAAPFLSVSGQDDSYLSQSPLGGASYT